MDWVAERVQTELANSITPMLMVPTEINVPGHSRHWDQGGWRGASRNCGIFATLLWIENGFQKSQSHCEL